MTPAYRVVKVQSNELVTPTLVCNNCNSKITFPIATAPIPETCSSCHKTLDEQTKAALAALARFCRELGATDRFGVEFLIEEGV